jgi:hypothetical protein
MSIIDTFNASDYLFIFIGSFLLTLMITPLMTLPTDGWEMVLDMVQLYFLTLLVFGFIYGYIKDKSDEITFVTQDKIYIGFFLVLAIIVIIIISRELNAIKHTGHGFLLTIVAFVFILICLFVWLSNSAINEQYMFNNPLLYRNPLLRY